VRFKNLFVSGNFASIFSRVLFTPKRKDGLWQPEDMQKALAEIKEGKIGLNECCRRHGIPKRSFKKHLEGCAQRGVCDRSKKSINGRDTDFLEETEEQLVQHILKFE
jgi:hypothetical protein